MNFSNYFFVSKKFYNSEFNPKLAFQYLKFNLSDCYCKLTSSLTSLIFNDAQVSSTLMFSLAACVKDSIACHVPKNCQSERERRLSNFSKSIFSSFSIITFSISQFLLARIKYGHEKLFPHSTATTKSVAARKINGFKIFIFFIALQKWANSDKNHKNLINSLTAMIF